MARETAKGIDKPDKDVVGETPKDAPDGEEQADLEGYTGPDGSKSLGYLKHDPVADSSGLGADADDAGRTKQEPGANTGGSPQKSPTTEAQKG